MAGSPPQADGEITLKLDAGTSELLKAAAEAAGRSVNDYAHDLIVHALDDWAEDDRIFEEYERTGVSYSVEEGLAVFDAAVKARFKSGS